MKRFKPEQIKEIHAVRSRLEEYISKIHPYPFLLNYRDEDSPYSELNPNFGLKATSPDKESEIQPLSKRVDKLQGELIALRDTLKQHVKDSARKKKLPEKSFGIKE